MKHQLNMKRQLKHIKPRNPLEVSQSLISKKQKIFLTNSTERFNIFSVPQVLRLKSKIIIKQIRASETATQTSLKDIRHAIRNKFKATSPQRQQLYKQQFLQNHLLRLFLSGQVILIFSTLLLQALLVPRLCNIITIKLLCLLLKPKDRN